MKNFVRFILLGLVLVITMSVGLGLASAQEETTLVIGWQQESSQLQPVGSMVYGAALQSIYSRDLWDWDANFQIYPIMAVEIPTVENGLVETLEGGNTRVTIHLREGMLWSDGEPITSADCQFWHDRIMMDPTTGTLQRGTYPDVVESHVALDEYTIQITYNVPWPDYQSSNSPTCAYPMHVLEPELEEFGILDNTPQFDIIDGFDTVSYGPYMLESWTGGVETTLVRNPYWDGNSPYWDRIVVRYIVDAAQQRNALEAGEIDMAWAPNWGTDEANAFMELEGVEVIRVPGLSVTAMWMNTATGHPALTDPNVRQAIVHAIDRVSITQTLNGEGAPVNRSYYGDQYLPGEDELPFLQYDPALAATMLDEAGWTLAPDANCRANAAGEQLVLRIYTTAGVRTRENYLTYIADYLSDVGVCVQQFPINSTALFDSYLARGIFATSSFDIALFGLTGNPLSPYSSSKTWFWCEGIPSPANPNNKNGTQFCDPEWESLMDQIGVTVDPVARLELAQQLAVRFFLGYHWHALYGSPTTYAVYTDAIDPATMEFGIVGSFGFHLIENFRPPQQ